MMHRGLQYVRRKEVIGSKARQWMSEEVALCVVAFAPDSGATARGRITVVRKLT